MKNSFKQLKDILNSDLPANEYAKITDADGHYITCKSATGRIYKFKQEGSLLGQYIKVRNGQFDGFASITEESL